MLDIIAGPDPADPVTAASEGQVPDSYLDFLDPAGLNGARIGLVTSFLSGASQEVRTLTLAATDQMESLGAAVVSVSLTTPANWEVYYNDLEYLVNRYLQTLGPEAKFTSLRQIIASGEYLSNLHSTFADLHGNIAPENDPAYARVETARQNFRRQLLSLMDTQNLDALVYPPLLSNPPTTASVALDDGIWETGSDFRNMNPSPFLGFPSITVPAGFKANGIPFGIEFLGRPFSEPVLLGLAYAFEQATGARMPPDSTPRLPGEILVIGGIQGDYDRDGVLDVEDIDLLNAQIRSTVYEQAFDLNEDNLLGPEDSRVWVHYLNMTWYGDANLDGEFNTGDLVQVLGAGKYETQKDAGWGEGDWNGDGVFGTGDFVKALDDGGYEMGPRGPLAVPEPSGGALLIFGALMAFCCRRAATPLLTRF